MSVTYQADDHPGQSRLILSLFPGIDLLGMAFEQAGYCVVRGPDLIFGGDIRSFNPPPGVFWGIIGGPPCQDFSGLRRSPPTGYGVTMLREFTRCVTQSQPEWWLMENVARVPDVTIPGYNWQRLDIDLKWFTCDRSRLRHIQFGSQSGRLINVTRPAITPRTVTQTAALANDMRSIDDLMRIQGLSDDFELPSFTVKGAKRAIGNGVPLPMGRELAGAVTEAYTVTELGHTIDGVTWPRHRICPCGCGRPVTGKAKYAADENGSTTACRKRAQRRRERNNHNRMAA